MLKLKKEKRVAGVKRRREEEQKVGETVNNKRKEGLTGRSDARAIARSLRG
jgi:hypothetical protein